ncbi:RrF2 family transcriptional regulator [Dethiothermospora halolimnae]|uniref:RrF2 family transcriptional regulator n=1 Tax=Dethiothermospora halolimnae TaxID=3114390 RepID=UPI003CCC2DF3
MKMTKEADCAMKIILYLSRLGKGNIADAKTISEDEEIPIRFTLKIMRKLTKGELTKSYRGVNGGYTLNKNPRDITMKDVIELIDGPIYINRCLSEEDGCNNKTSQCSIKNALKRAQYTLIYELERVNFRDLI